MNLYCTIRFFISGLVLFISLIPISFAFAETSYNVAMITWRGETVAELGFIDELDKSTCDVTLIKYHADQNRNRLQKIITKIQSTPVDLIYVFGTTATKIVLLQVKDKPVVFNIVNRPVGSGIIANWESSENNATGASNKVPVLHQLRTLKKVVDYHKLGIIYNPGEQNSIIQKNIARKLEDTLGFELKEYKICRKSDVLKVLPLMKGAVDAVYLPADSMTKSLGKEIIAVVNEFKLPSLSAVESMVPDDGALLGLVPNYYELGRLAAKKALKIFQGKKPAEIPSSALDYFNMSVNMKTAQKINVQIPMSILVMANKIVR
ncbi:MAG: ABC transporter substrate-binding protein [Thermodesulfobacteriota bacterium]|nr:ABC transporter substrate-binding protein [Thermodesulfobacteriota bacterium]